MSDNTVPRIVQIVAANWWVLLIRGVLLIALGAYALLSPGLTLIAYTFVLGAFLFADGMLAIIAAIAGWTESRGWTIARGVLALLVGAFAMWHPAFFGVIGGLTVVIIIALQSIIAGVLEIVVAIRERKTISGEGRMILSGLFSILFGAVLILAPLLSLVVLIRVSGIVAILFGVIAIFTSFKLRRLAQGPTPTVGVAGARPA